MNLLRFPFDLISAVVGGVRLGWAATHLPADDGVTIIRGPAYREPVEETAI